MKGKEDERKQWSKGERDKRKTRPFKILIYKNMHNKSVISCQCTSQFKINFIVTAMILKQ
jgi:hypothetical protein